MENNEIFETIKGIRDKIYTYFSNIDFKEEKHEYFVNINGNVEKYNSVSNVISQFNLPFDSELVAEKYAEKHGLIKENVLKEWKYKNLCSTISGTRAHLYGEGYTWLKCNLIDKIPNEVKAQYVKNENWLIPTSSKEVAIKKFYDELPQGIYPIGAEFMMSSQYIPNIKTKMCGTADLLCYYDNPNDKSRSGVILMDWKSNSSLENSYNRNNNITMLPPFDFLIDEALQHYSLQFGCYELMLRSIGIPIIGRRLIWLKDNDYQIFKIDDRKQLLLSVL